MEDAWAEIIIEDVTELFKVLTGRKKETLTSKKMPKGESGAH